MTSARSKALTRLLDELEAYTIDFSAYYSDLEPQSAYDEHLSGKLDALMLYCKRLGWQDLAAQIHALLPLRGDAIKALTRIQDFILPEIQHLIDSTNIDGQPGTNEAFWQLLHPRIVALARPRFEQGFYGDAAESCFKEVNDVVKRIYFESQGRELDGSGLMTTALSPKSPVIRLTRMDTQSDLDEQQGYMQIFAGAMTGIRNPKAHGNLNPDPKKTLHLVSLASLLMHKLDERI